MAYRLKSRDKYIPNGFKFVQPQTGWQSGAYASFTTIVNGLIAHRRGRPDLVAKHGWSLDYDTVANEVEQFNVNVCARHGWMNYLEGMDAGGGMPPKSKAPSPAEVAQISAAGAVAKKIWAGVRTLNDWLDSEEPPVIPEISTRRAKVCAECPKNGKGDLTSWFTIPAAGAIKHQLQKLTERKIATPLDDSLNICEVCLCPLKLKVHTPLKHINTHMTNATLADLQEVPGCWIPAELADKG